MSGCSEVDVVQVPYNFSALAGRWRAVMHFAGVAALFTQAAQRLIDNVHANAVQQPA